MTSEVTPMHLRIIAAAAEVGATEFYSGMETAVQIEICLKSAGYDIVPTKPDNMEKRDVQRVQRPKVEIVLLHQNLVESILSDIATFVMIVCVIGAGVLLRSPAMQWCGFAMLIISGMARPWKKRRTPQEAADCLQEQFGVRAGKAVGVP